MVNVRPDRNFEYPLLHSKASQRINPLPQTIKGNCYFYWFVTEFGQDQHISILTENYCQEKNPFPLLYTASLITTEDVIPAKAGIQENTGFPRIKYGAGLVKPGMTNRLKFMSSCIYSVDLIIMLEAGKSC